MESLERLVNKHDNDLYRGNGKPGITTRLALNEERLDNMEESVKGINKKFFSIALMVAGVLLTLVSDIIIRAIK